MPPKKNPLKLNNLQLKTLTLLQVLAELPDVAAKEEVSGNTVIKWLPDPHGNHFHMGAYVVMGSDATGLHNPSVWAALVRKGLAVGSYPDYMAVTDTGLAYETGLGDKILHRADH